MLDKRKGAGDPIGRQVQRLSKLPGYRGPDEYLRVLSRIAKGGAHAEAIIDEVMDQCMRAPSPMKLREIAQGVAIPADKPEESAAPTGRGCPECTWGSFGTPGMRPVHMLVELSGGIPRRGGTRERISGLVARDLAGKLDPMKQGHYEAIEKCACAGGRAWGELFTVANWGRDGLELAYPEGAKAKPPQPESYGGEDQSQWVS